MKNQTGNAVVELVFTLMICVVLLVVGAVWHVGKGYVQCSNYSSLTERETKYSIISGCFVKAETGRFVPLAEMTRTTIVDQK